MLSPRVRAAGVFVDQPEETVAGAARAIGHMQRVKKMMENDEDCSEVLIQLAAVEAALHNLGKEIINEHMAHCVAHAIEDGDMQALEDFQEAIKKFT